MFSDEIVLKCIIYSDAQKSAKDHKVTLLRPERKNHFNSLFVMLHIVNNIWHVNVLGKLEDVVFLHNANKSPLHCYVQVKSFHGKITFRENFSHILTPESERKETRKRGNWPDFPIRVDKRVEKRQFLNFSIIPDHKKLPLITPTDIINFFPN